MSKTNKEQRRDEKEGQLKEAIVDGRRVYYSDSRIARPLRKLAKNSARSNGRKPKIVFA